MSKISINKFASEVLAVTLGVLLAFGLTEWNNSRNKNILAETSFNRIILEIRRNREVMREKASYYKSIAEESKKIIKPGSGSIDLGQISSFSGFNPPQLLTSAYETAITSQALSYMDVTTIEAISAIYKYQDWVVKDIDKFSSAYLFDKEKSSMLLQMVLGELAAVSAYLVKAYDKSISALVEKGEEVDS